VKQRFPPAGPQQSFPCFGFPEGLFAPLMDSKQENENRDNRDLPGCLIVDRTGGEHFHLPRTLAHLSALLHDDGHFPSPASRQGEVGGLEKPACGCPVQRAENKTTAFAIRRRENQSYIGILDDPGTLGSLDGNTEVRLAHGERIGACEERDHKTARLLAQAQAAAISVGAEDTQGEEENQRAAPHHIPIPRICMGCVKSQMPAAYIVPAPAIQIAIMAALPRGEAAIWRMIFQLA
jgi:hypothetical protein